MDQNVHASEVQHAENDTDSIQGLDSQTCHQSRNELTVSQRSYSRALQQQQSGQTTNENANTVSREVSGLSAGQVTNSRRYFPHDGRSSERQVLPRQSSPSREFQSLQPQRSQRLRRDRSAARKSHSGIYYNEDCQSQSTMRLIPNKSTAYQNSRSQNQQPPKTKELGIQVSHLQSQNLAQGNRDTCQLVSQQLQQHHQRVSVAAFPSRASQVSDPLPESSSGEGFFTNRNQNYTPIVTINYSEMEKLRCPYANRSETVNILVYGPINCTNNLLHTFKRGLPLNFVSPFTLAHQTNITRCGVLTSVSVWQSDDLIKSTDLLRSLCVSSKCTVIIVGSFTERSDLFLFIKPLIEQIRRNINQNVPIILVWSKISTGILGNLQDKANRALSKAVKVLGFKMKAKFDLSAFLDCSVDLVSDVDDVFFTAIDVSRLIMA